MTKNEKNNFLTWFKRRFFAGIWVVVPILITLWLAGFLYVKLTGWAVSMFKYFVPECGGNFHKQDIALGKHL